MPRTILLAVALAAGLLPGLQACARQDDAAAAADRVTALANDYMAGIFVRTAERENWSTASRRFKQNLN